MAFDSRPPADGRDRTRTRSLSDLFRTLAGDLANLVRQEIALARLEFRRTIRTATGAVSRLAIGAGVGGVGTLTILAGVVVLVGELIGSYWLSAVIIGAVLLGIGGVTALGGARRLREVDPTPRRSIESVQESVRWARTEMRQVKNRLLGGGRAADRTAERSTQPALASPGSVPLAPASRRLLFEDREPARTGRATPERIARPARAEARTAAHRSHGSEGAAASLAPAVVATPERSASSALPARRPPAPTHAQADQPKRGVLPFLKHLVSEIQEDNITGEAARLAYYAFMALPPALMALFGLAGLIGSAEMAAWLQQQADLALPASVSQGIVNPFIEQVVLEQAPGPFSIGLVLALWGGSALFTGLIDTLNNAYDIEETRPFLRKRALAMGVMLGGVLLFISAAGTLLIAPAVVDYLGLGRAGEIAWNLAQWPVAFGFMVLAFWGAYYFLPNRDQAGSNWTLVRAAAFAAALWVLATAGFRIYIANFNSYNETYGFLGGFIILLLWLYMTSLVVLVGGEIASEMERREG